MRRREFLTFGAAAASSLVCPRLSCAQPASPLVRGAVVVGVDKAGMLPKLSAASTSAKDVADWLTSEGFEVKLLTDGAAPVTASAVYNAVDAFVDKGTLDQLVIYFSGHGVLANYASEYWMLSGAPTNSNEAVNLYSSGFNAQASGIRNIIFISDACRSIPNTLSVSAMTGQSIFRMDGPSEIDVDIDFIFASRPGQPALELPVAESAGQYQAVFTSCLLQAFKQPDADMISEISPGLRVVPNRKLERYLVREVQKLAEAKSIVLKQSPTCRILSEDNVYIGRVLAPVPAPPPPVVTETATIKDVAKDALSKVGWRELSASPQRIAPAELSRVATQSGYSAVQERIEKAPRGARSFETQTGFSVTGTSIVEAVVNPQLGAVLVPQQGGDGDPGLVRVQLAPSQPACSIAIRFVDGSGTVMPALKGFIGHVSVVSGAVANVSYVPSSNSDRWSYYSAHMAELDQMHAAVATASKFGVFHLEGDRVDRETQSAEFGDKIRVLKSIDPTLGLYAAYAYAEGNLTQRVQSVRDFMQQDLQVNLFDIALLSSRKSRSAELSNVVPFCPMLGQGWALLQQVSLPASVRLASRHLRVAPWTTFEAEGLSILIDELRSSSLR